MEYINHPAEYSAPPPEHRPKPELEYTALPPEYGQKTYPEPETAEKGSLLRRLLVIPALLLTGFLCFHSTKAAAELPDVTEPLPVETTAPIPEETAAPIPELPEGSVILDVRYAVRDGDTVLYEYEVYTPTPSLDATQEQIDAYEGPIWPVSVYAQVTDADNHVVYPEQNPDVWEDYRYDNAVYTINAAGLPGDLTLTLRAVYTEQGEERQTVAVLPLAQLPPAPSVSATLEAYPGGDVDFHAVLQPQPGDDHDYDLQVWYAGQLCWEGDEWMGLSLVDDPKAMPITGDRESGFHIDYSGGSAAAGIPDGTELSLYVGVKDLSTGYIYDIESNRVSKVESLEPEAEYPLGDGKLIVTVYNDTFDFEVPSPVEEEDGRTILAQFETNEADFDSFLLPSALTPAGYDFAGWVIHVNNPMDLGSNTNLFMEYNGDPPVDVLIAEDSYAFQIGGVLTRQDVERVPPTEDGVRYVNIHASWIYRNPTDLRLYLQDGMGGETAYGMDSPAASEGFLYLCTYPIPQREGYEFDGWYDWEGNRVELLMSFFSFTATSYDADGSFLGYDWSESGKEEVYLTAHWKPK